MHSDLKCGAAVKSALLLALLAPCLLAAVLPGSQCLAQGAPPASTATVFKTEEIDQLMAPIALYPDQLLAQVLTAATYPLEVVMADRWAAQSGNAKLKGEPLDKALQAQPWDGSVKSLVPFPAVLKMMSDRLDWTRKLGDAFLAQPKDCLASAQRLRQRAVAAGKLASTPQMQVTSDSDAVVIRPANPQVVYVPMYNPTVVYGAWPYPTYPPYYYPPPPGYAVAAGVAVGFAVGVAVNNNWWGWGHPDWHGGTINVNVNQWNQINANRTTINGNTWRHDALHRDGVAYRDTATREQFAQRRPGNEARRDFRGFDQKASRRATLPTRNAGRSAAPAGRGAGPTERPAQRAGIGGGAAARPTPAAFRPESGASARADSARGLTSRQQTGSFADRRQFGGAAGGRGGHRGGGFRR